MNLFFDFDVVNIRGEDRRRSFVILYSMECFEFRLLGRGVLGQRVKALKALQSI